MTGSIIPHPLPRQLLCAIRHPLPTLFRSIHELLHAERIRCPIEGHNDILLELHRPFPHLRALCSLESAGRIAKRETIFGQLFPDALLGTATKRLVVSCRITG